MTVILSFFEALQKYYQEQGNHNEDQDDSENCPKLFFLYHRCFVVIPVELKQNLQTHRDFTLRRKLL